MLLEFHHDEELDQIEEMNILMNHLTPLLRLDYHNDNNNLVLKILLQHFCHVTNYNLKIFKLKKNEEENKMFFLTFHDQLMSTRNQLKSICMIKCFRNILSECIASTSRRYSPTTTIIRVRPKFIIEFYFFLLEIFYHNKSHIGPSCGTS